MQMSSWLHGTRKVYHDELSRDVRLLTLLGVAFFSPGKQAALCNLSRYLALLTTATSNLQGPPSAAAGAVVEMQAAAAADEAAEAAAAAAAADTPAAATAGSQQQQQAVTATLTSSSAAASPTAAAAGGSNLLRYVPVVYVEVVVDFLTALRKSAESAVGAQAMELQVGGAGHGVYVGGG